MTSPGAVLGDKQAISNHSCSSQPPAPSLPQPQPLDRELDISSPSIDPLHNEIQRQNTPNMATPSTRNDTSRRQQDLEKISSSIRSKVHSLEVLPPQQLATLAVISSLGEQAVVRGASEHLPCETSGRILSDKVFPAQSQTGREEQKDGALTANSARRTQ